MIKNMVYYLPGMGGRLVQGLGEGLLDRGFMIHERELHGEFYALSFREKIDVVTQDLRSEFWSDCESALKFDPPSANGFDTGKAFYIDLILT